MINRIMQRVFAKGLPTYRETQRLESSIDNRGLEEYERRGEETETIYLASIFGGTSIY
jgi:hypothetical protein